MSKLQNQFLDKDFWVKESESCRQPNIRHIKGARLINSMPRNSTFTVLDVGCGPATLEKLLGDAIVYYGIDIAIHTPAPNLFEIDVIKNPIRLGDMKFDVVVVSGLFEYMGQFQLRKISEIREILKEGGKFIVSYTNFNHVHAVVDYAPFNNIMPIREFRHDLELFFNIDKFFPIYYNWKGTVPSNKWSILIQKYVTLKIPFFYPRFAVSYFFVCSEK